MPIRWINYCTRIDSFLKESFKGNRLVLEQPSFNTAGTLTHSTERSSDGSTHGCYTPRALGFLLQSRNVTPPYFCCFKIAFSSSSSASDVIRALRVTDCVHENMHVVFSTLYWCRLSIAHRLPLRLLQFKLEIVKSHNKAHQQHFLLRRANWSILPAQGGSARGKQHTHARTQARARALRGCSGCKEHKLLTMGKDQELLQAVKTEDLITVQKLLQRPKPGKASRCPISV